jgi:hypothetical protein
MSIDNVSEKSFFVFAGIFFATLILAINYPILLGEVPLPAHLVTQFAAWDDVRPQRPFQQVADIGDLIDDIYPFNAYSASLVRQGIMPFWNPNVMDGMPILAEPQNALFYPLHFPYYVLPTHIAWTIAMLVRPWLAAMFMVLLMRSLGATRMGSVLSGLVFSLCGFVTAWQGYPMGDTVMWLPFVCYSILRLHRDPSRRSIALTAFAFAMTFLAGHPETAIHIVLTGSAAALLLWVFPYDRKQRFDVNFLLRFAAAGLLAAGLTAIQLLPTAEWIRSSGRTLDAIWPSFGLHQLQGFFTRDVLRGPNSAGIFVPNASAYVGMLTFFLAVLGLLHPFKRYVIWFAGLAIFGIAATFGIEPVHSLLIHTPIIKSLKNERLILLSDFGLAALAGFGISVVGRRLQAWLLTGGVFIIVLYCIHGLQLATAFKVEVMRRPSFSRMLLLIALALVVWRLLRGEKARLFPIAACALLAFDLGTFAFRYTGFVRPAEIFPPAPVFEFLKKQGSPYSFRIAQINAGAAASNSASYYGLQSATGYEAIVPDRLQRYTADFSANAQPYISFIGEKTAALQDRRLDFMNVKYIYVGDTDYSYFKNRTDRFAEVFHQGQVTVFENKTVLPRAFIESGDVQVVTASPNRHVFRVETSTSAVLFVSQNPYPGWTATVDGQITSVFPEHGAFTGIAVPSGIHEITLFFDPLSFKIGAMISLVSLLIFLGLCGIVS